MNESQAAQFKDKVAQGMKMLIDLDYGEKFKHGGKIYTICNHVRVARMCEVFDEQHGRFYAWPNEIMVTPIAE